jgi:hypothetical protein
MILQRPKASKSQQTWNKAIKPAKITQPCKVGDK